MALKIPQRPSLYRATFTHITVFAIPCDYDFRRRSFLYNIAL